MKCTHCSARIDRSAWFCPNCKRSSPRAAPGNLGRLWLPVTVGLAALTGVGMLAGHWLRPGDPEAQVDVREVAIVQITPHIPDEAPPEPPKPVEERPKRAAEPKIASEPEPEPEVVEEFPAPTPPRRSSESGALSVSTDQPAQTFVYLDGGTLLGQAPVRNAAVPAGKHTLVFWTPSLGGRSKRTVNVSAGEMVEVVERVRTSESFKEESPIAPADAPG
ncbi:MAG: hypothetical protein ACO1SX_03875 [Actinomycetota bacterium]